MASGIANTTGKTQDDPGILDKEMLKFASVRVPLAVSVGLLPVLVSSLLYVSTFSFKSQIFIGLYAGLIFLCGFQLFEVHRSTVRRLNLRVTQQNLRVTQLSEALHDNTQRLMAEPQGFPNWATFTDFDDVQWLNKQMHIIWPFFENAISETIKAHFQLILNKYAMGVIKDLSLQHLTLGTEAPRFNGIGVSAGEEETVLKTMIEWTPENAYLELKIVCPGFAFKVKVKDIHASGTLIFIMKPLLDQLPPFGAVLLSFTETPDVDFTIKLPGGITDFVPGVENFIDISIRTALMDSMVWPRRIVVPVAPGDWSYLESQPVAELHVTLFGAEDIIETSNPFVSLYLQQRPDEIKRSSTKKNKKSAVWNEGFILGVEDKDAQKLTVKLMDENRSEEAPSIGSHDIGSAEYKISKLKPHVSKDVWLDMVKHRRSSTPQQSRGRVHLRLVYIPFAETDPRRTVNKAQHDRQSQYRRVPRL